MPSMLTVSLQTTGSYLVLVTPVYSPNETPYKFVPAASTTDRHFLPGPGEALPLQSVSLRFEGVIRIEGQLLRYARLSPCHVRGKRQELMTHSVYHLARNTSYSPPRILLQSNVSHGRLSKKTNQSWTLLLGTGGVGRAMTHGA